MKLLVAAWSIFGTQELLVLLVVLVTFIARRFMIAWLRNRRAENPLDRDRQELESSAQSDIENRAAAL